MLTIIGWVWVGIIIGVLVGTMLSSLLGAGKVDDLVQDNLHLKFTRDALKQEIFRLENQNKPKPRKHRKR